MVVGSIALVLAAVGLLIAGLIKASDIFFYASIAMSALAALALIVGVRLAPSARIAGAGVGPAEPDATGLGPTGRGSTGPGSPGRGSTGGGSPGREVGEFDSVPPDGGEPDTAARPIGRASVAPASMAEPKVAGPKVAGPKVAGPKPAGPKAALLTVAGRGMGGPDIAGPDIAGPDIAGPDIAGPAALPPGAVAAPVPPDGPASQVLTEAQATRLARLAGELKAEVIVIDGRPRYHLRECLHLLGRDGERLPAAEAIELGFTPCGQCEPATALLLGVPRI